MAEAAASNFPRVADALAPFSPGRRRQRGEVCRQTRAPAPEAVASKDLDDLAATVDALRWALTVKRGREGDVLSVSVTSTDPARAARIANAVAEDALVDPLYARLDAGRREFGWLNERLPIELRERLRESEEAVVAFRAAHNLVDGGQNVSLDQEQMAQLNTRLVTARANAAEKKAEVDLLQKLEAEGTLAKGLPEESNS